MMNIKDKDVNPGVGMNSTKFSIQTKMLSTSAGAGANADSILNLAFATSDPLSELVWSPSNGLTLKSATSRADDSKPLLLWNVGPSSPDGPSPLQTIREKSTGDEIDVDVDVDDMIVDGETLLKASETAIPATPLRKLESSAKNDCDAALGEAELPKEDFDVAPAEGSSTGSMICLYNEKGKEKALSEGDSYGRSSYDDDDDDDDDDSAKSCNSVGPSFNDVKGVKRQMYDNSVILGSKRMRMQIHGSHDNSFMKWISNMTKVLSDCSREDSFAPLTIACSDDVKNLMCFRHQSCSATARVSMGFQTIFQSLYSKEADVSNTRAKNIALSIEDSTEQRVVDDNESSDNSGKEVIPAVVTQPSRPCSLSEKASDNLVSSELLEKGNPRTSLWIARLSTKASRLEKGKEIANEAIPCSSSCPNAVLPIDQKSSSHRLSSEAMTSVFARRLDALRHITLSRNGKFSNLPLSPASNRARMPYHMWKFEISSTERSPGLKPTRDLGEKQSSRLCDTVAKSEVFDAVRSLRLSRADILKWMNSDFPLSRLNGFFLRLRVGSSSSSSYYVACITGDAGEDDRCMSSKSISVDVGGVKSFVASQYISNHDFLEDEIEAWWCRTADSGCRSSSLTR